MSTARQQLSGNRGTSTAALAVGGLTTAQVASTEEFSAAATTRTVDVS